MAQTRMNMPLSANPSIQPFELWNRMAGRYAMYRLAHHDQTIDGEVFKCDDIESPSLGYSEITARPSTESGYFELLQRSKLQIITKSGKIATIPEKRIFRLRDGKWSIWGMQDIEGDIAGTKLTDLEFRLVVASVGPVLSQRVTIASENPWQHMDRWNNFTLTFFLESNAYWDTWHEISTTLGSLQSMTVGEYAANTSRSGDQYFPLTGG